MCSRSEEDQDQVGLVGSVLQVRSHVVGEKELQGEDDAAQVSDSCVCLLYENLVTSLLFALLIVVIYFSVHMV